MNKTGYKTTEFWITSVISLWAFFGPSVPAPYNIVVPAIVSGLYVITRGLVKSGLLRGDLKKYVENREG